jgi:FkbM family methyltransferase
MRQVSSAIAFDALFLFPSADQTIGPCLASAGEFARAEVDFLIAHLSPNGAVCDVGANIGTVSIPLAKAFPGLSVFAFEPQLPIFRLLMRNVALNGLMSVEPYPWALGETDGVIEFATPALTTQTNFGAVGRGSQSGDKVPVVIRRLDSFALPSLSIIKIDVEGHDLEVVRGAQETIQRDRPILFCEAHASPKTVELIRLLVQWDYDAYWFFAPFVSASASEGRGGSTKIVGDTNVVAFPKGREPRWPLPRIGDPEENWRRRVKEMHYLKRYGCYPQPA